MKKNYIRPALTIEQANQTTSMMSGSITNGGDYTAGSTEGESSTRRGGWGNLWEE